MVSIKVLSTQEFLLSIVFVKVIFPPHRSIYINDDGSVQTKANRVGTVKWTRRMVPDFVCFFTMYPDFIDTLYCARSVVMLQVPH